MGNINFTKFTQKNTIWADKPNEDFIFTDKDEQIFIILDGVTRDRINGIYPQPSPSEIATYLLGKSIYNYLHDNLKKCITENENIETLLLDSVICGNFHLRSVDFENTFDFLPGAVGIISILIDNTFYYAYIGDCIGIKISDNDYKVFTDKQTKLIQKQKHFYNQYTIRNIICNNPNHPLAYGVLNGDENAISFVKTGFLQLQKYDQIILATDGLETYIMNNLTWPFKFSREALKIIEESNKNEHLQHQDDKSVIVINFQ